MAQYLIQEETMKNIADNVRALTGSNESFSPAQLSTEVQTAKENVDNAMSALEALGVEIPEGSSIGDLAGLIENNGVGGTDTSDATATSADILSGKTAYVDGEKVTGTIPSQDEKTITPSTSSQTAVASGVYTTGEVTVGPIPNNYEDVGTETTNYTNTLAELTTAISELKNDLAGKASGGGNEISSYIGDWIDLDSLPTTYIEAPDAPFAKTYYIEVPRSIYMLFFAMKNSNGEYTIIRSSHAYYSASEVGVEDKFIITSTHVGINSISIAEINLDDDTCILAITSSVDGISILPVYSTLISKQNTM